jgi:uncharacterized membrane protein YbaN (DUF454 family)
MAGKKLLCICLGLSATALGIIGVWVPGMPTTIFVLIALWAFSKSSQRLYAWLTRVPVLRAAIREAERFQREKTIDLRVKLISQSCSWLSVIVVALATQSIAWTFATVAMAISCSVFMCLTPSTNQLHSAAKGRDEQ